MNNEIIDCLGLESIDKNGNATNLVSNITNTNHTDFPVVLKLIPGAINTSHLAKFLDEDLTEDENKYDLQASSSIKHILSNTRRTDSKPPMNLKVSDKLSNKIPQKDFFLKSNFKQFDK